MWAGSSANTYNILFLTALCWRKAKFLDKLDIDSYSIRSGYQSTGLVSQV
jgi:hypothetical protein